MKTIIQINGKDVEITLTKEQVAKISNQNPMEKVYTFHNTTEESFNEQYKDVSDFAKAQEIERMIVNFYNRGVQPNWDDSSYKYYPYFNLGKDFSYYCCHYCWHSFSSVSARLCFLRKEDLLEAVDLFKEQYENSRNK
jgi:hypothetical protein